MVAPDLVDDIEAQVLARDIAKQIEEELTYPGQIKVTVVRDPEQPNRTLDLTLRVSALAKPMFLIVG
jgi:HD superfamily phosphodiesterase